MQLCRQYRKHLTLQETDMKIILLMITAALLILEGCSDSGTSNLQPAERDVFAMDTYMNLKAYGEQSDIALYVAANEISRLEKLLSVTDENSDIWKINHANGNRVDVDEDVIRILHTAIEIGNQTEGSLDITMYPVLKEWGFTTADYQIPSAEILSDLLENVDYTRIETADTYVKLPHDSQIDFGALAKGYTGDAIMDIFREHGVTSAIINLGGNVQTMGCKPDGSLWNVAVVNPFSPDSNLCVVSVADKAVITSGSYERYFIGEDGQRYWHIIDPKNGYPADNGLVSVTIIGDGGLLCDALSTALFVAGTENAITYWQNSDVRFDMILVTDEGRMLVTEDISQNLTGTNDIVTEIVYHD